MISLSRHGEDEDGAIDRRLSSRTLTIYRLVQIYTQDDEGLARCRNISDTGMKLDVTMAVEVDEPIEIAFATDVSLRGYVKWVDGLKCGVYFEERIDSAALLAQTSSTTLAPSARPPRLKTNAPAKISYDGMTRETIILDVSQRGLKLTHDGTFRPGLNAIIVFGNGRMRHGVVRWVKDGVAGLMLLEWFSVEELGSVRSFR